jgi:divalent metal cation (Fe/Co/Zn/Cd) transporter
VRSRGAGGSAAVDLHVRVSPKKTVQEADAIAGEVRRCLLALDGVSDVTVHLEAQRTSGADAADIFATVKQTASQAGLTIHESWAHRTEERLYLEVHVGVDPHLTLGEAHDQVDLLERELYRRLPEVYEVRTHIEMAARQVELGDRLPLDMERKLIGEIEQVVGLIPELTQPHNISVRRNRNSPDGYYVSLECIIAANTPVSEAHHLSKILEGELSRHLEGVYEVFVHLEPEDSTI